MTTTTDWNTVTSDLQRAANNLAWFVLESMTIPGQPPPFMPLQTYTLDEPKADVSTDPNDNVAVTSNVSSAKRKRVLKHSSQHKRASKVSIGKAVDCLVSETLV